MCEYIILEDFTMDKYIYDENNDLWYELCKPPIMGNTIAAVFLCLSAVSVKKNSVI